jgi:hypothetical protein
MSEGLFYLLTFLGLFFIFAYLNTKTAGHVRGCGLFCRPGVNDQGISGRHLYMHGNLAILLFGKGIGVRRQVSRFCSFSFPRFRFSSG